MVSDSTLGVAVLLLCHAILLWCWLVCLSQFKTSGEVSAFIEYLELKIPFASPITARNRLNGEM